MYFRRCTKEAAVLGKGRRDRPYRRDLVATGVKLFAGVALLAVLSPRDLYAQDRGIQAGAFLFQPSFSVDIGYDNNATNSQNEEAALEYDLKGEVNVESNWSRHSLTGGVNASLGSDSEGEGCDCGFGVSIGTRLDAIGEPNAPKSLSFGIAAGTSLSPGSSSRNGVLLAERSQEYASRFGASTQGRVNRFYGSVSGEHIVYRYEDAVLLTGSSTFVDSHRDRTRTQIGLNGGYEVSPNLRVVGNFGVDLVRYDNTNVGRIDFNITRGTAGVEFSVPDSNIGGGLQIGAQFVCGRDCEAQDTERTSFSGAGSLDWEVRRTVRLGAVLSTDFHASETETTGNLGTDEVRLALTANTEVSRDVGLDVMITGSFLDHIVQSTGGGTNVDRSDTQYSLSAVSTYRFVKNYGVKATLTYSGLTSSDRNANYQSLYFGVGLAGLF